MLSVLVTRRYPEVRTACAVTHDAFCEVGYQEPNPRGVRLLPHHLNPGTLFLVGSIDTTPAASAALVADGPFGLPSDRAFAEELDEQRALPGRLYEIGSLAVLSAYRTHTRDFVNHVFAALAWLVREAGDDTKVIASVEPSHERTYDSLFSIGRLCDQDRPLYGAPATLCGARAADIDAHLAVPAGAQRRRIWALRNDRAGWLSDHRRADEWPACQVLADLAGGGYLTRLERQRTAIGELHARAARDSARRAGAALSAR